MAIRFFLLLLFFLPACCCKPQTDSYRRQYSYLNEAIFPAKKISCSEYTLIIAVSAKHLDYSNGQAFLATVSKHPRDGSKNSDVGHAWIWLFGPGTICFGGHSGETGVLQPTYFEGMMDNIELGSLAEPNPVRYLWEDQKDGFFQKGSGGHVPSCAIKIHLSKEQFEEIFNFIKHYLFSRYSLTENQCTTFVKEVAALAAVDLESKIPLSIPQKITIGKECLTLWEDPFYSKITIASPDILEKSMIKAVKEGKAEYALPWYLKYLHKRKCTRCHLQGLRENMENFPWRYKRHRLFRG